MTPKRTKEGVRFLTLCLLAYALLVAGMTVFQRSYIYLPDRDVPDRADYYATNMDVISVTTADGLKLSGWYKPPAGPSKPVIVFFQGNGGNMGNFASKDRPFIAAGYGFLFAEYRGYGGNPGAPSEQGFYTDARAYLAWLTGQGIAPGRIVLFGQSIGTGVAVQAATEYPQSLALILESPFTSLGVIAQRQIWYIYVAPLLRDRFDNIAKIAAIHVPLLIVHGQRDGLVPYSEGVRLFAAANRPKTLVTIPDGTHMNLGAYGDTAKILSFLRTLETR